MAALAGQETAESVRSSPPSRGERAVIALSAVAAAAFGSPAAAAPIPAAWAPTPVAMCHFQLDVSGKADPYDQLSAIGRSSQVACPFVAGKDGTADIYVAKARTTTCEDSELAGLRVVAANTLTPHQFGSAIRCAPLFRPTKTNGTSPELVLVRVRRALREYGVISSAVTVLSGEGLPLTYLDQVGNNDAVYVCAELMEGAHVDLLGRLRRLIPALGRAEQVVLHNTSCFAELKRRGVDTAREAPAVGASFKVEVEMSTASPPMADFDQIVQSEIGRAGLSTRNDPTMQGGVDLLSLDGDQLAMLMLNKRGAEFESQALTPDFCRVVFDLMSRTDAFSPAVDDQSSDIIPASIRGSPPQHHVVFAVQAVASPKELCDLLQPAFSRWRTSLHPQN